MDKKELKSRMDQLSGFVRKGLGIALTLRTLADLLGGRDFLRIADRAEAIRKAVSLAGKPEDLLLIAGKGHETYQEIKGVKYPFDEKIVVSELLKEL